MAASNETGILYPMPQAPGAVRIKDAAQAWGKVPVDLEDCDAAVFSGHKIGGPRGAAVLWMRPGLPWAAVMEGPQERRRRGGTEDLPAILGLAEAVAELPARLEANAALAPLRDALEAEALSWSGDFAAVGRGRAACPTPAPCCCAGTAARACRSPWTWPASRCPPAPPATAARSSPATPSPPWASPPPRRGRSSASPCCRAPERRRWRRWRAALEEDPAELSWIHGTRRLALPIVRLKPGKEDLLAKGHPWVYSGALAEPPAAPLARLADASGNVLGVGTASAVSPLAVRLFLREDRPLDGRSSAAGWNGPWRAGGCWAWTGPRRAAAGCSGKGTCCPGLVVDRYGPALVVQVGTQGLEALREAWWPVLLELGRREGITAFVERSQGGRKEEGLEPVNRLLKGSLGGPVTIREGAALLTVDLLKGQKTGMFLDQREHRLALGRISGGCRVLNAFGYTGGFSIHAGLGGAAEVATLDISGPALDQAERDWARNGLDPEPPRAAGGGRVRAPAPAGAGVLRPGGGGPPGLRQAAQGPGEGLQGLQGPDPPGRPGHRAGRHPGLLLLLPPPGPGPVPGGGLDRHAGGGAGGPGAGPPGPAHGPPVRPQPPGGAYLKGLWLRVL